LESLLVETGYTAAADVLSPAAMGSLAAAPAHEVVRLEAVAEAVARRGVEAAPTPAPSLAPWRRRRRKPSG
jgi:hypothetical protein